MIKRSEEQWRELFEEQAGSQLSAGAFCRERKLCPKYFSLRRRQLLGDQALPMRARRTAPVFVPARVLSSPAVIEVQAGLVRLRLPGSVSAVWLAELVRGLS